MYTYLFLGGAYSQGCPANCVTRTANSQGCPTNCVTRTANSQGCPANCVTRTAYSQGCPANCVTRTANSQGCPANCVTRTANSQGWINWYVLIRDAPDIRSSRTIRPKSAGYWTVRPWNDPTGELWAIQQGSTNPLSGCPGKPKFMSRQLNICFACPMGNMLFNLMLYSTT